MNQQPETNSIRHTPEKWGAVIVALIPFAGVPLLIFLFVLVTDSFRINQDSQLIIDNIWATIVIFWYLSVFVAGWIKGFPRWWYPYSLFIILAGFFLQNSSTPGLWLFGLAPGDQVWGARAWVSLGISIIIALLLTRSFKPFVKMSKTIGDDPTRLAFTVFGLLPFVSLVMYDEVKGNYQTPFLIISMLLLSLATIFYMRASQPWHRLLSLYSGSIITALINSIAVMLYWDGRMEAWMTTPMTWQDQVKGTIMFLIFLTIFILGPALSIELVRNWRNAKPINPTLTG